jgi:hypothetical protein
VLYEEAALAHPPQRGARPQAADRGDLLVGQPSRSRTAYTPPFKMDRMSDPGKYEGKLLNLALNLSLEFGENWRKPIQPRLLDRWPGLTEAEANELDEIARGTRDWAHNLMYDAPASSDQVLIARIRQARPWIDDATFGHLWSQGCYYRLK